MICVTEQTMVTKPLYTRPRGDILHVAIRLLHLLPVLLQRQRNQ